MKEEDVTNLVSLFSRSNCDKLVMASGSFGLVVPITIESNVERIREAIMNYLDSIGRDEEVLDLDYEYLPDHKAVLFY